MEKRHALSDDQWDTIADLMPSNNGPGRPWAEYRLIIDYGAKVSFAHKRLGQGSPTTVRRLLRGLSFSPRVNVKRFTGPPHPDRDTQFQYLRRQYPGARKIFIEADAGGSRLVETMLTVIETCRQQGRNLLSFVTAAVRAHLAGFSSPSLLPGA